jgi:C6 transcription factor Pro1
MRLDVLEKILRESNSQFLPSSDITALKFFVTGFIWVDILSCASGLRTFEPDSFDYTSLLEDNTLELHKVMGCHNWVMITIMKIANLDNRKKTIHPNDILVLQDFLDQAMRLQCSLETGIANLLHTRSTVAHLELDSNLVTEMFAHAALTYLHVAISGAYPDIPEIRISVARALSALILLPSRLLLRISWPFCIIACMAAPEQEVLFREVFQKAVTDGEPTGTIWKGLKVAEESWRLRGVWCGKELAWKEAMGSLGVKVLPV